MLFLLTGDVQIGKTRWLEALCALLAHAGANVAGVIAPGRWVPRPAGQAGGRHGFDGAGRFEKLGIDNVLLPQGERIEFARRRDLASAGDAFAEGGQAKAAQLGWAISDSAIEQVNQHFAELAVQAGVGDEDDNAGACEAGTADRGAFPKPPANKQADGQKAAPGLLVVDELGRLELLRGCGLTQAVRMLDAGPTAAFPHALVVVRDSLLDAAVERFSAVWGVLHAIGPDDKGKRHVLEALGL